MTRVKNKELMMVQFSGLHPSLAFYLWGHWSDGEVGVCSAEFSSLIVFELLLSTSLCCFFSRALCLQLSSDGRVRLVWLRFLLWLTGTPVCSDSKQTHCTVWGDTLSHQSWWHNLPRSQPCILFSGGGKRVLHTEPLFTQCLMAPCQQLQQLSPWRNVGLSC